jgi:small-conductance mechanosensitive channel
MILQEKSLFPNGLDLHQVGTNRPAYGTSWCLYDRLVTFGSKPLADGTISYDYTVIEPELAESCQPEERVVLVRNDDWKSGPLPAIAKIIELNVPEAGNRRALLEKGDVDINFDVSEKDISELKAAGQYTIVSTPIENCLYTIDLNTQAQLDGKANPFSDVKVRQVVAYAMPYLSFGQVQRRALRTETISRALQGMATVILFTIGILWTLNALKLPTESVLAGGAILGLAISFGSQSLVKDVVNGCLILMEDQFAVGDVIDLGHVAGEVETLNLRVTQLRNVEGRLITIPNSAITEVQNLTRLWSRVDFTIEVAYDNDPQHVLSLLDSLAQQMYTEPAWCEHIAAPPEILGIDTLSHSGMLIRVWIKTAPAQQWAVGREFRLRVRQAFAEHGIQPGRPQRVTYNAPLEMMAGSRQSSEVLIV